MLNEKKKLPSVYIAIAVLGVLLLRSAWIQIESTETLAFSDFIKQVQAGNVDEVAVNKEMIHGKLKQPLADGRKQFLTLRVDDTLLKSLAPFEVKVTGVSDSNLLKDVLGWVLPTLFFFGIWMLIAKRIQKQTGGFGGGLLSIGKSRAKVYVETDVKVTFADVAGVDEAKQELSEIVGFLKDPKQYGRLGGRLPKGVLLVGPPGTGKTLLARAVAGEAGVPFFSINGSEFVEMFVGVGAARVRDLFAEAAKQAPAIIFIDEIDALGRARGGFALGGHDEKEQTLNQLLAELDGFDSRVGLVLLAATNRPEILDPALLRAGRFDRQVLVDRPDRIGRVQILNVHLKKIHIAPDLDIEAIASMTPGFSGADLANLVNEAALQATRRMHQVVDLSDFTMAIERIVAGLEKRNRLLNPKERAYVAHHEMGHALVAMVLPGQDAIHKVSIIPRGIGALGYTLQRPTEDRFLMTRSELENKIAVLLGGRAAEQIAFGEVSTGAADDLVKVTDIARSLVVRYGMDPDLGPIVFESQRQTMLGIEQSAVARHDYSEETARKIDAAVRALVVTAFERTVALLTLHRELLDRGAKLLLEKETLGETELLALLPRSDLVVNADPVEVRLDGRGLATVDH